MAIHAHADLAPSAIHPANPQDLHAKAPRKPEHHNSIHPNRRIDVHTGVLPSGLSDPFADGPFHRQPDDLHVARGIALPGGLLRLYTSEAPIRRSTEGVQGVGWRRGRTAFLRRCCPSGSTKFRGAKKGQWKLCLRVGIYVLSVQPRLPRCGLRDSII